jgi:hypothetical protein
MKVPLEEIAGLGRRLEWRGWTFERRVPTFWIARYSKSFPAGMRRQDATAELREVMGRHWVSEEEVAAQVGDLVEAAKHPRLGTRSKPQPD